MDIKRNSKDFLNKLQSMSELKKKIILWTIVAVAAVILGYFLAIETRDNFKSISQNVGQIQLPNLNQNTSDILQTTSPTNENPIVQGSGDATSDWKTYTDSQHGFEIKYPTDWIVQENLMSPEYSLVLCPVSKSNGCVGGNKDNVFIFTYKNDPQPKDSNYYFLGLNSFDKKYYYFYNDNFDNKLTAINIVSTFKFTK